MIHDETEEEGRAAAEAVRLAYIEWSDRYGIDAEEGTKEQLAELYALIAKAGEDAVAALRNQPA